jgi:hypothetical protein
LLVGVNRIGWVLNFAVSHIPRISIKQLNKRGKEFPFDVKPHLPHSEYWSEGFSISFDLICDLLIQRKKVFANNEYIHKNQKINKFHKKIFN